MIGNKLLVSGQLSNTGVQEPRQIELSLGSCHYTCLLENTTDRRERCQRRHILGVLGTHSRVSVMTRAGTSAQSSGYATACSHAYTMVR